MPWLSNGRDMLSFDLISLPGRPSDHCLLRRFGKRWYPEGKVFFPSTAVNPWPVQVILRHSTFWAISEIFLNRYVNLGYLKLTMSSQRLNKNCFTFAPPIWLVRELLNLQRTSESNGTGPCRRKQRTCLPDSVVSSSPGPGSVRRMVVFAAVHPRTSRSFKLSVSILWSKEPVSSSSGISSTLTVMGIFPSPSEGV